MAWYGSPLISHRLIPKDQLLFMASASHPLNPKPPKFILQRSFCGSNNKIPQSQPCWWWIQGDCWSETRPINRLIAGIVILGDGILERLRLSIALLPRLVILRDAIVVVETRLLGRTELSLCRTPSKLYCASSEVKRCEKVEIYH